MSTRSIQNRLLKVERRILPEDDGPFTLEELCRCMWREDKRKFLEIAKDTSFSLYARQFEYEDAEPAGADRRGRRPE